MNEINKVLDIYELHRKAGERFGCNAHLARILLKYLTYGGSVVAWIDTENDIESMSTTLQSETKKLCPDLSDDYLKKYTHDLLETKKIYLHPVFSENSYIEPLFITIDNNRNLWDRVLIIAPNTMVKKIVLTLARFDRLQYYDLLIRVQLPNNGILKPEEGFSFARYHYLSDMALHSKCVDELENIIYMTRR